MCRVAATVFQNPVTQICTATPRSEVAFGLVNVGCLPEEIPGRVAESLSKVGLEGLADRPNETLSGGQQQRLAIACALALNPKVLLLDEPVSQVDPRGASEILGVVRDLSARRDLTVVLVEHRVEDTLRFADRVVLLDGGRLVAVETREEFLSLPSRRAALGLAVPELPLLFERLGRPERPETAADAPQVRVLPEPAQAESRPAPDGAPAAEARDVTFRYRAGMAPVFRGLSLAFRAGERVALMGGNGSGKTTLLHLLAGLLTPEAGEVRVGTEADERPGLVMQSPDVMLFCESVREEVAFAPTEARAGRAETAATVTECLRFLHIEDLAERPPFALSRGQRLRTAVASVLSLRPRIMLLDEPTTGQDRERIERMMESLADRFDLLVFCTHDARTAARHADRIVVLDNGAVALDGTPAEVLFDRLLSDTTAVRPTELMRYAARLGLKTPVAEELLERLEG